MSAASRPTYVVVAAAAFLIAAVAVTYAGHCQAHYEYCATHNVPLIVVRGIGIFIDDHNGVFVALFTGTLWWTTKTTLSHLRREFLAAHRPRLVLRSVTFDGSSDAPMPDPPKVKVEFANVEGLGPITLVGRLAFGVFPTGKLIPWKMAEEISKAPEFTIVAPYAGSAAIMVEFPSERSADFRAQEVTRGSQSIYCVGYVSYADANGAHSFRLGFVRRCDLVNRWFEAVDFPDFSYAD